MVTYNVEVAAIELIVGMKTSSDPCIGDLFEAIVSSELCPSRDLPAFPFAEHVDTSSDPANRSSGSHFRSKRAADGRVELVHVLSVKAVMQNS